MPPSDVELLREYAHAGSEASFAELVRRHLDLVYAAAKRQLGSPALAEDVAQSVFLDLARQARKFPASTPLVAWLHLVTRRTAIDLVRHESRRLDRERTAVAMSSLESPSPSWSQLAPLLDEALARLSDTDRAAILLRFFEDKSLREAGAALGLSDDATQKRLTRALDRLRTFFARRGIAVTAAALATELPVRAVEAAPATLGPAVSSTIAAHAVALAFTPIASSVAMTLGQKILVTTALVAALGAGLFEAQALFRQNAELARLRQRTSALEHDLASTRAERDAWARELSNARAELASLRAKAAAFAGADPAVEAALDAWLQNVVRLKQRLENTPASQIPELKYLTAKDWLDATKENPLATDMDFRAALSQLRLCAKLHFSVSFADALHRYLKTTNNQPLGDVNQLAPYFDSPVDPALLARYKVASPAELGDNAIPFKDPAGNPTPWVVAEKQSADPYFDSYVQFDAIGWGYSSSSSYDQEVSNAIEAYRKANADVRPSDPAQLVPYLHSVIDPEFIRRKLTARDHL